MNAKKPRETTKAWLRYAEGACVRAEFRTDLRLCIFA